MKRPKLNRFADPVETFSGHPGSANLQVGSNCFDLQPIYHFPLTVLCQQNSRISSNIRECGYFSLISNYSEEGLKDLMFSIHNVDPLAALTAQYGQSLELICPRHKLFMMAALTDRLLHHTPMSQSLDEVDPLAYLPDEICYALESLERLPDSELLKLIGAIAAQLAASNNRPTK